MPCSVDQSKSLQKYRAIAFLHKGGDTLSCIRKVECLLFLSAPTVCKQVGDQTEMSRCSFMRRVKSISSVCSLFLSLSLSSSS